MKDLALRYLRDAADIFADADKFETPTEPTRASPRAALFFLVLWTIFAMFMGAIVVPFVFALIAQGKS